MIKNWHFWQISDVINRNPRLLKKFGKHLKELRESRGFSQEALANEAELPISQIGRIERGEVNPTLSTLYSMSTALKINLQDLVTF